MTATTLNGERLYNLVGLGQEYDSDRALTRFAVVRRERMAAW